MSALFPRGAPRWSASDNSQRRSAPARRQSQRLFFRMLVAKADREAVPEIDEADQSGEVNQLFILKMLANFV